MKNRSFLLIFILAFLIAGCQSPTTIPPTSLLTATPVPTSTATPLPTSTPEPTIAPTPTREPTQSASEYCDQLLQRYQPAPEFQTYCDRDYGFAFDYPQGWRITFIAGSADSSSSSPITVRKAQRFEVPDMSNYIRVDTYHLYDTMTLLSRVQNFFGYEEREFANKDYPSLTLGGRRAYAVLDRWQQDYSAVYLFFQHGQYYTIMEIKAISRAGLETNWQIARSLQTPGMTPNQNIIPQDLIDDSYQLLP